MNRVWMPGTAGEFVQGWIDGVHVHVSAPIDRYAVAEFEPGPPPLEVPPDRPKTRAVLLRLSEFLSQQSPAPIASCLCSRVGSPSGYRPPPSIGGRLVLRSQLAFGKGLGSSTADLAASCFAVASGHEVELTSADVARLALAVEPTDGSVFAGVVAFDHRDGRHFESLGPAPTATLLLYDCGGAVDTVAFSRTDQCEALAGNGPITVEALALARAAIAGGDLTLLGRAATMSAIAHQRILPKPELDEFIRLADTTGASGVSVAHSGTTIGLIYDPAHADPTEARRYIERRRGWRLDQVQLTGGGPRYTAPTPSFGYH